MLNLQFVPISYLQISQHFFLILTRDNYPTNVLVRFIRIFGKLPGVRVYNSLTILPK